MAKWFWTKLLLDENVARSTITLCRALGFDVRSVKEEGWDGKDDAELLQIAQAEDRVILTLDKDFGNLLRFPLQTHRGVILFRMRLQHPFIVNNRLQQVLPSLAMQDLRNTLVIVQELTVRIRR